MRPTSRGNILFLILLAVVLFAALAYAVTSSMRGGGKDGGAENAQAKAAAMLNFMNLVRSEVQRLMLVNDCKIENIEFRSPVYTRRNGNALNPAPITSKSGCALFTSYGGGVTPIEFEKFQQSNYNAQASDNKAKAGHALFRYHTVLNQGTARSDVVIRFEGMDMNICLALAKTVNPSITTITTDTHATGSLDTPEPNYTTDTDTIGQEIQNQNSEGLFFTALPSEPCSFGLVIIPQ